MSRRIAYLMILLSFTWGSCAVYKPVPAPVHFLQVQRTQARDSMPDLDIKSDSGQTTFMENYIRLYDLEMNAVPHQHIWGTFTSDSYTLVAQVFIPRKSKGTILLVHGYMDHVGTMRHLIQRCLEEGYTVATYDLPGHGLSSGAYASIPSFSVYADTLNDFVELVRTQLPPPYYAISHSTGSAITLEYLSQQQTAPFERTVLVAPLVRHAYWWPVKSFFRLGQIMQFKSVSRRYKPDSGDKDFLAFRKQDPLAYKRIPATWVAALYEWEKSIQSRDFQTCPDLVIQGTADTIVDGPYNIKFLKSKCPNINVQWIDDGGHYLFNESKKLRDLVFDRLIESLDRKK